MAKVVTMGEIMLRLSSAGNSRFVQCQQFDACYGGGEANVAVSLANYGHDAFLLEKGQLIKDLSNVEGSAIAELNNYFNAEA